MYLTFKHLEKMVISIPENLWLGVTVCNQEEADKKIPLLLQTPAAVRFVSIEPMLGKINIRTWINLLDWVICGGESGRNARMLDPNWVLFLLMQCKPANVPFFFKQWGEYSYVNGRYRVGKKKSGNLLFGEKYEQFPEVNHESPER